MREMKAFQTKAKILRQARIKGSYWHCEISAARIADKAMPGQFVNIKVSATDDPLLRRPLSIHGVSAGKISILYEVVGRATEILSGRKSGELLDIIGPLGKGFDFKERTKKPILVCGGMGVAPLAFLAERLKGIGSKKGKGRIPVLLGAKTKDQLLCEDKFKRWGYDVRTSTDDGSAGFKGRITDLLKKLLEENRKTGRPDSLIYACGPQAMLKNVAFLSRQYRLSAQLSLEEHMACGIGACCGCALRGKEGNLKVCNDGPVFDAERLVWGEK